MAGSSSSVYLLIIGITVLTSLVGLSSPQVIARYAIAPWFVVREGRWHQMLTSGFLHGSFGHLFVNMLTLFFFGRTMEAVLGAPRFLGLYFGSLFFGSLGTLMYHRNDRNYRAIGASGAVSGIVFGFVLFAPFAPIYIIPLPIGIPALLFAIGYGALSIYWARSSLGGIGHSAHLGGAIGGVILTIILYPDVIRIFLSHFR